MKLKIGVAGALILFLRVCTPSAFAQAPLITNVTNAAIPAIDYPPVAVQLAPRSIATIFGTNLADAVVTTAPPWKTALGGTEVHFVVDTIILNNTRIPCDWQTDSSCELTTSLIYASPTQINFLTPDSSITLSNGSTAPVLTTGRIVLIRDGVRFDARYDISGGPGYMTLDPFGYTRNPDVFGVGYECLFSFSLTDPLACGLSWSQGQHRALLGAVTDISGNLITSQNPVRQGELITLWMTGLTGLNLDPKTGLLQQATPGPWGFGVAQSGSDIPATISFNSFDGTITGLFQTPLALFAGESPIYMGLDQVNAYFPMCVASAKASVETRYDAFMDFTNIQTGTHARVYLPFLVSPGDQECGWVYSTMAISSSVNPSLSGQPVTFTAIVSPAVATGTVQFFDGTAAIGTAALNGGAATFSTLTLSAGTHSIAAAYSGDGNYGGSSATRMQTVMATTTTAVVSNDNPSISGQSLVFTATVSPSGATGTVTFFDGTSTLGVGTLSGGNAACGTNSACSTSGLGAGSHSITAKYSGDSNYGSSSGTLTQIVGLNTIVTLASSANPATVGQSVNLSATVSPCCIATGTVTFLDGNTVLGSAALMPVNGTAKATFSTSSLSVGAHSITAKYSGDGNNNGSTSTALTLTIWTISLTSSPNPATSGQLVTFSACGIPQGVPGTLAFIDGTTTVATNNYVLSPCSSYATNILSPGTHSITARYSDAYGGSTSATISQTVGKAVNVKTSTTITLTSTPLPGGVTFEALVSPGGATGTVMFFDNGVLLGSGNLNEPIVGGAQLTGQLLPGSHLITAQYGGDASYNGCTSASVAWTGTSITLSSSLNPSTAGKSVIFTATVSPSASTGSVTFSAGGLPILCAETGNLSNGQAKCTASLVSGTFSVLAAYSGNTNPNYSGSSGSLTQTVK
jgi:hypothetical protein